MCMKMKATLFSNVHMVIKPSEFVEDLTSKSWKASSCFVGPCKLCTNLLYMFHIHAIISCTSQRWLSRHILCALQPRSINMYGSPSSGPKAFWGVATLLFVVFQNIAALASTLSQLSRHCYSPARDVESLKMSLMHAINTHVCKKTHK